MNLIKNLLRAVLASGAACVAAPVLAQSAFPEGLQEFSEARDDAGEAAQDVGGQAIDALGWGIQTVASARELAEAYEGLSAEDDGYDPLGLDDGFQAPSECADDPECQGCYRTAMAKIDFNRFYLHRAWSITHQYTKYAQGAMSFGDSASGIHGVAGLSWQMQGKPQIRQSLDGLQKTYRGKYTAYIKGLNEALGELGQCEASYAGNDRWFGRYAAMYVEMVKNRYQASGD